MRFDLFSNARAFYVLLWLAFPGLPGLHGTGYGQVPLSLDPTRHISQYVHEDWQTEDGLPQNSVSSIIQTHDGYLWLGTEEGLVRFDGHQFDVYDKRRIDVLRINDVVTLLEDHQNRLWIGTRGGGLYVRRDGRFEAALEGHDADYITALYEDGAGRIWIGTYGNGLIAEHDGVTTAFGPADGLTGEMISHLTEDADGTLWVGTNAGLFRFDGRGFVAAAPPSMDKPFVTLIHVDALHRMWVAVRDRGLFVLEGDSLAPRHAGVDLEGYVSTTATDTEGSLWFGTSEGQLLRYRDGTFEQHSPGLNGAGVYALAVDREGNLWIGTRGAGLHRLRNAPFTPFGTPEGLSNDRVYSMVEHAGGGMWVATASGLNLIRDNRAVPFARQRELANREILTLLAGDDGELWAGTYGEGLYRLHEARLDSFQAPDALPSNHIFALEFDAKGRLWVGTDHGVAFFDGRAFTPIDGLPSPFITAIEARPDGDVWIGTYDAGLVRFSKGLITRIATEDGLSSNSVLSLYEDPQGVLWAGTYGGGLNRIEDGRITAFTTREGLFNDNVYVILEDDAGHLWMSCNKGIFSVARASLERFAAGDTSAIESRSFGRADGLRNPEGTGGQQPAGWRSADGRLWFSTIDGVATIDPLHIPRNLLPPPVSIERILVNEQEIALNAPAIELAPGVQKLEVGFTALSLVVPERIQFRYRLEGIDTGWSSAGPGREAVYTNLPPGHYTFHVIASNNDGVWNERGASLSFHLQPWFYQTLWFRALVVLFLGLVAFSGYRLRIMSLKARQAELERVVDERTRDLRLEKEKTEHAKTVIEAQAHKLQELDRFKTRFFANISHEFRTPLTMIIGPLENALGGVYGSLSEPLLRQVRIMLRNAQRLLRLINQLLDLSKLEAGKMELRTMRRNIVPFLESVLLSCTPLAEKKDIALVFEAEEEELGLYYEPDKLENVFYNLLSNALKFTPRGGRITFTVARRPANEAFPQGYAEICVADTGRGIPAKDLEHIFDRFYQVDGSNTREHEGTGIGLALVHELVLLHKGTIEAESEVAAGTRFTIRLPLGSEHLSRDQIIETMGEEGVSSVSSTGVITELAGESMSFDHEQSEAFKRYEVSDEGDRLRSRLVLVVDDNADVREYVSGILNDHYNVEVAVDGQDALEKAHALKPDLIISDVMMPRMDGNELCRRIKASLELDHIPVILMTARATNELRIAGLEMGADDYIAKPFNARELLVRARNLLLIRHQEKTLKLLNEQLEDKVAQQLEQMLEDRIKYEQELLEAKERAEASLRLKSTILDNINHEFRTPIAGILGSAEILEMEAGPEAREFVGYIKESTLRLQSTLDAVVELASLEGRSVVLEAELLDFRSVVRDAAERYGALARRKGLDWSITLPDDPVWIRGDEAALLRVLDHLLDNAIKFTPKGRVQMRLKVDQDAVSLDVADTGIGISEAFIPRLFDAFVQESDGIARTHEGVGIGLTIARQLAELMHGQLSVQSRKGKGSVFTLVFPREVTASGQPTSNTT